MIEPRYTATEIFRILCEAYDLDQEREKWLENHVKYLAKRGILKGGVKEDKRGTLSFTYEEVYRAAILSELALFNVEVSRVEIDDLERVIDAVCGGETEKVMKFGNSQFLKLEIDVCSMFKPLIAITTDPMRLTR